MSWEDVCCRNCGEVLFAIVRQPDGSMLMRDPGVEPESDGVQKYFLCPACEGKNLVMLIDDPPGSRYYEIAGFIRS